jgi:acetyl esterase/lipase
MVDGDCGDDRWRRTVVRVEMEEVAVPVREEFDIQYGAAGERPLFLDLLAPEVAPGKRAPAVIYVHGGGWVQGDRSWSPNRILAEAGFVTVTISYRFSGEAIFPAQIHDVKAAIRWVRANAGRYGIDPARVGIWGHSAGGHLAALAAVTAGVPELEGENGSVGFDSSVHAVVPMAAPVDFLIDWYAVQQIPLAEDIAGLSTALLGGPPHLKEDLARLASPLWHVSAASPPHLLIHGEDDDVVPINQVRAYVAALRHAGQPRAELIALPGVDHMSDAALYPENPDPLGLKTRVVEFFREHLS